MNRSERDERVARAAYAYLPFERDALRAVSTAVIRNTSIETRSSPFFQT